jgi:radical SAM protein with 4Fe4S-binding SPASM domain
VCFGNLFNWGEPFLNPDIFKIIDEIYKSGAISHVHTNFSLKKQGLAEAIAASKLTSLVLSIDGASEETYLTYRRRGDWGLVQANIRKFVQRRRALGKKAPEIVWKFIVHKHNEHEVDGAVEMARASGVDKLQLTAMWADLQPGVNDPSRQDQWAEEWLPVQRTEFRFDTRKQPLFDHACPFLWQDPVINIDGTVSPCCFVNNSKYNFGDLKKNTFAEIWNNDKYRYSRSLFSTERYDGPRVRSVCETCTLYRQVDKPSAPVPEQSITNPH